MLKATIRGIGCALLGVLLVSTLDAVQAASPRLPEAVRRTLEKEFPGATVKEVERERENGVLFYDVSLTHKGKKVDIEVAANGSIGEIESEVRQSDLPASVADEVSRKIRGGKISRIERHERRGVMRAGKVIPLKTPRITYEVKYLVGKRRRTLRVVAKGTPDADTGPELPRAVQAALARRFPGAETAEVERDKKRGRTVYEVEVRHKGKELEILFLDEGTVLEVAEEIDPEALPRSVSGAVSNLAPFGEIEEAEKIEIRAVLEARGRVRRIRRKIVYECEVLKDDTKAEVRISADGRVLVRPVWSKAGKTEIKKD